MKNKNYLVAHTTALRGITYVLSRGNEFEYEGLALVHLYETNEDRPNGVWAIIDIASGLFISSAKTKKKLVERWNEMKQIWIPRINGARKTESYGKRIRDLNEEKRIWRESGYVL